MVSPQGQHKCGSTHAFNSFKRGEEKQGVNRNVERFRGGLAFKAHRLCVSLNSRLESNKEGLTTGVVSAGGVVLQQVGGAHEADGAQRERHLARHVSHVQAHVRPTPHTLHPAPYTLHPTPYTLHPTSCTLHPTPYTLHPTPYTQHPTPYTLHPTPYTPLEAHVRVREVHHSNPKSTSRSSA